MNVWKPTYTDRRHHALKLILDEPPPGRTKPYRVGEVAGMAGVSTVTARRIRRVTIEKHLMWTNVAHLGEAEWTALLNKPSHRGSRRRWPDWVAVHAQMSIPRMTIQQQWKAYQALNPSDALSYKRFAALYLRHRETIPFRREEPNQPSEETLNHSTAGRTLATTTRTSP